MKEVLVTFPTAKLAKDKGFDWKVRYSYGHPINPHIAYPNEDFSISCDFNSSNIGRNWKHLYSAPTQSLLQRWLREKHDIHININTYYFENLKKYGYEVEDIIYPEGWVVFTNPKVSYEEALEFGLQQALKLIEV